MLAGEDYPAEPSPHIAAIATAMGCPSRSPQCNKRRERGTQGKKEPPVALGNLLRGWHKQTATGSRWSQSPSSLCNAF